MFLETRSGTTLSVWQGDNLLPELHQSWSCVSLSLSFLACVEACSVNAIAGCLDLFYVSPHFSRKGMDVFRMVRGPDLTGHVMSKEVISRLLSLRIDEAHY